jgi:uncharacterized membrane protein YhdT
MTSQAVAERTWSDRITSGYQARGYLFREAMAFGIGIGIYLHLTRLLIGIPLLREHILTPAVDVAFGVVMVYIAAAALAAWRMVAFRNPAQRWAHGLVIGFVVVSIPLHLSTLFTHSTGYIDRIPRWYSMAELVLFFAFIYLETHLRLTTDPPAADSR